jgi:hypothetical protein
MLTEPEATQVLRDLLETTTLQRIDVLKLSSERFDAPPVGANQIFPMNIQVQMGEIESAVVFRVVVSVERPDAVASVELLLTFQVADVAQWQDPMILRVFGGQVAVPAAVPIARAKIREATSDMGTSPITLGLYSPKTLVPGDEEDGSTQQLVPQNNGA